MKKTLFYISRILTTLISALFLIFVIGESIMDFNLNWLFTMLLPGIILAILTYYSWKNPKLGGIVFTALAVFVIIMIFFAKGHLDILPIFTTGIPLLLSGILFLFEGFKKY